MGRGRRRILIGLGAALLAALIGGRLLSGLYVDAAWFSHLGFRDYFWKLKLSRWLIALGVGTIAAVVLLTNLYPFARLAPRLQIRRRYGNIEIAEVFPRRYLVLAAVGVSVVFGWVIGLYAGGEWTLPVLQLVNAGEWGRVDPIFSRDLSFYVFVLPLIEEFHALGVVLILVTIVLAVLGHGLTGGLGLEDNRVHISVFAERHLGVLGGVLMILLAAGYWVGMQELMWSGNGVTGTLGYTDATTRFPARRLLIVLGLLGAAAFFVGVYRSQILYGGVSLVVLGLATLVLNHAYPSVVQRFRVDPNELDRERPYLAHNMAFTRLAYGLHEFEERDYPLQIDRIPDDSAIVRATTGLPLWDTRPLRATYNQLQGINPYYTFVDVDYDRYGLGEDVEQVAVSVREIDIEQLPPEARTWQNLHLSENYTHGLGLVMTPAARARPTGEPIYYLSGIPPVISMDAPPDVRLEWPQVYFGETSRQYVLVREPEAASTPRPMGIDLNTFLRKLSFAWTFGDKNLLLSQELRADTRILYRRNVRERIGRLAPFLLLEPDIYPVVARGRIYWIQDAYTASPHFPLAERTTVGGRAIRYIRNSVKIVVDALTGETRFYVVDPTDPVVASLVGAFPGLFSPLDGMPDELRRHLRYPVELLLLQARILRAYHVRDPRELYHQLDLWDLPVERYREGEEPVQPYYVVMPDPASDGGELSFLTIYPLTARGRDNMRALLVARAEGRANLTATLFRLPSEQVLGPRQVEVRIDQDPLISQQFTLWQQRGSRVIRGHLLVIPVAETFIYVEPIFLEAQSGGAAPSLERVVLATADRVAMGDDLEGALAALVSSVPSDRVTAEAAAARAAVPGLERLNELVERADQALRAGDLATFGRLWGEIRALATAVAETVGTRPGS